MALNNHSEKKLSMTVTDNAYGRPMKTFNIEGDSSVVESLDLSGSSGWYDYTVRIGGDDRFLSRHAGRVESSSPATTDPLMGGVTKQG